MTELNQEQHIQLLQFMSLMQNCKTENEMQELKEQYYNIPRYSFLQDFIPEKERDENLSSYKTNLIYKMDKYQHDYKFVYGEIFPAYKKETMPEKKADYTVSNLLNEISECEDIEAYQKLLSEKNRFPKVKIETLSQEFIGIYFSDGLPGNIILNSPESNFNARTQLVEAGYSPFTLPSVEDVRENGFDWLHEEISHFKETLNPNFVEMENQMNSETDFNEKEYEEEYDDFIEQMNANSGMSAMAAEADYNASLVENEDIDEVQRQMDIDNGLTDENGNEILYDGPENEVEEQKTVKAIDIWNEIYEGISEGPEYEARKIAVLDYLYNKGTDDMAGYKDSFERNTLRLEEISKSDEQIGQILEKYKDYNVDFDDEALAVKIAGTTHGNLTKAKQDLLDFVENKKYLQESDFEKYIHSEEFISKFGDWEKANRLEKLKESESLTIDNQIIIHGNNVTNEINDLRQNPSSENLKILTKYVNELGKEMVQNLRFEQNLTKYENPKFIVSNDNKSYSFNFSGIKETSRHNIFQKGHIEGIANIPEIIEASFYIGTEKNEDNRKPELSKFHYYGLGIKLDNEDFTAKVVFTENKQGEVYYDQSLSNIEKGRLIDIIQMDKMPENLSPLITQRESEQEEVLNPLISQENLKNNPETVLPHIQGRDSSEVFSKSNNQPPLMRGEKSNPPKYYDKRLMNICQVPQMPYLEKNTITGKWQPTKEAVEAVKNGALFVEKQGQTYVMNERELKITNKVEQENKIMDSVGNKKYLRNSEITQEQDVSLFDKELQEFIDGKLPKSHIFSLGKPSEILVKCGFPAEQRIELSASHLEFKSKLDWHPFDMKDVMGLEYALKNPIAVFEYGNRTKSQNIIVNIEKDGKNFLAGVHFNQSTRGYEVSDIRTLFPKDNIDWLRWIEQGKMIYGNKEKLQALIAQQRINVAEVNSQVVQSPLHEHCLESCSSILDKFGEVKDIFADEYQFYEDVKKKAAIEQKFFNYYVTKGNLDARELSVFESEEFYNALISGDAVKIDEYTKTDLHEINELAAEIYEEYSKDNEIENTQKVSDMSQYSISNIFNTPTDSMKVNESLNTEFSNNDIPVENNEVEQEPEPQNEPQNYENNNSNVSAPKPKNKQELHQFFINNPYSSGTPVPTIAMRNEQTGHSTFIEGYEFARLEDIGNEKPAFKDENGNQIKPDGQTVVLTKPAFKDVIDEQTGEKKLVPDENNRKFIKISRDLYEQAIKNSEIIAKRNPKTKQEKEQMVADYEEAAHLDERKQRVNTADNFWHNYQAGVMTFANNKQEAMAFAKRLVNEMIPSEKAKFANMVNNYEKIKGADGKHLSYNQRILERYEEITKGLQITNKSIWRDHIDKKFDVLDAIKRNTEVFDKEGQPLDKTCRMKIGDTIKMSITVDSALSNKKIKLPLQEFRLVAHSKDNNSVALISVDGKQKIFKNREDFIKQVQKIEKKQIKKQQRQDKYESISM